MRKLLQQAVDALHGVYTAENDNEVAAAIAALETELAKPEQKPVASIYISISGEREFDDWKCALPIGRNELYTSPPRKEWQGLTDACIQSIEFEINPSTFGDFLDTLGFARAIEAAAKELNK